MSALTRNGQFCGVFVCLLLFSWHEFFVRKGGQLYLCHWAAIKHDDTQVTQGLLFAAWLLSISFMDTQSGFYINATGMCPWAVYRCTGRLVLWILTSCHPGCCVLWTHFHYLAVFKKMSHFKAITAMALSTESLSTVSSKVWGTAVIQRLTWMAPQQNLGKIDSQPSRSMHVLYCRQCGWKLHFIYTTHAQFFFLSSSPTQYSKEIV